MVITVRTNDVAEILDGYHNKKEDDFESISGIYEKLCNDISDSWKFDVEIYRKLIKYVAIYDETSPEIVWNINDPMQLTQWYSMSGNYTYKRKESPVVC